MRKTFAVMAAILLISGLALGQATQQPPSTGQSGMSGMNHPQAHPGMMSGNMQDHMQQMKAALDQMKQNLETMKADAGKMDNEVGKDYMEKNNQLWQQMVEHLDMMMSHMGSMQGMGMPSGTATHPRPAKPKQPTASKPPQK